MRTTLRHPRTLGIKRRAVYLAASFLHEDAGRPTDSRINVMFVSASRLPRHRKAHNVVILADGKQRMVSDAAQYRSLKGENGRIYEVAEINLPYDLLLDIISTERVEARLGTMRFAFTHNHLEALRELASLVKPTSSSFQFSVLSFQFSEEERCPDADN